MLVECLGCTEGLAQGSGMTHDERDVSLNVLVLRHKVGVISGKLKRK